MPDAARITLNVFDGTRRPVSPNFEYTITIRDGHLKLFPRETRKGPRVDITVPFNNNGADDYTVIVSADGYPDAGFMPVRVSPERPRVVGLMLLRKEAKFDLGEANWSNLSASHPDLIRVLSYGARGEDEAKRRYADLAERRPEVVACLLNVFSAMQSIHLPNGTPRDYFRGLRWDDDSLKQDRFYAYCDKELFNQVSEARDIFKPDSRLVFERFHKGATSSFREVQFGEANVQLSFHDDDEVPDDLPGCTVVEADIDYYKDLLAHGVLEVLRNDFAGPTDPKTAYVLRWIAGRNAEVPPFDPPYVMV